MYYSGTPVVTFLSQLLSSYVLLILVLSLYLSVVSDVILKKRGKSYNSQTEDDLRGCTKNQCKTDINYFDLQVMQGHSRFFWCFFVAFIFVGQQRTDKKAGKKAKRKTCRKWTECRLELGPLGIWVACSKNKTCAHSYLRNTQKHRNLLDLCLR